MQGFCSAVLVLGALAFANNSWGESPFLDSVRYTNGQFRFTIHGETKADYVVLNSTNMAEWHPVTTNQGIRSSRRLSFAAPGASGSWRAQRLPLPWFNFALSTQGKLDVNGNNFYVDSFDSLDPLYSTADMYDATKRKANGDVAAGLGLTNSLNVGISTILGHLVTLPGSEISIGPDGSVGDLAWAASQHTGAQAGYITDDMSVVVPQVAHPFPGGGLSLSAGGYVNGITYDYILGNGNYQIAGGLSLSGNQNVLVTGTNTLLYVSGNLSLTGNAYIQLLPGAAFKLYVGGATAQVGGNGIINPGLALNFIYYGLTNHTSVSLSGNAAFTGIMYTPQADVVLGGGGSNTYDFVGAIVSKTVTLNGHYNLHFDESLQRFGPLR